MSAHGNHVTTNGSNPVRSELGPSVVFLDHPTTEELLDHILAEGLGRGEAAVHEHLSWCEDCEELANLARSSYQTAFASQSTVAGDLGRRIALAAAVLLIASLSWLAIVPLSTPTSSDAETTLAGSPQDEGLIFRDDFDLSVRRIVERSVADDEESVITVMDFEQPQSHYETPPTTTRRR